MAKDSGVFEQEPESEYEDRTKDIRGNKNHVKEKLDPRETANRVIKNNQRDGLTKRSF